MLPPQSYLTWKVCASVLHALAIGVTLLRIYIRWKDAKLWWDDHVASAALLADVAFGVLLWLMFGMQASDSSPPLPITKFGWLQVILYFVVFWISRVSLALSIARVFPSGTLPRRSLIAMAAFFFFLCASACLLNAALCLWSPFVVSSETLIAPEYRNCQPGSLRYTLAGGITAAADFTSDILAIVVPLVFLWRISLPPNERYLIHGTILATVLASLSGVITCIFWYAPIELGPDARIIVTGTLHIQAAISLVVCNLLVVVTYCWRKAYRKTRPLPRRYRHNDPNMPSSETQPQSSSCSGSQSQDEEEDDRVAFGFDASSRLPADLTFTPITPLSTPSASDPVWSSSDPMALKTSLARGSTDSQ